MNNHITEDLNKVNHSNTMVDKKDLMVLPEEVLKLYYNEYQRRYKQKNKGNINAYAREHYKRYKQNNHSNTNNLNKEINSNTKVESIFEVKQWRNKQRIVLIMV